MLLAHIIAFFTGRWASRKGKDWDRFPPSAPLDHDPQYWSDKQ